MSVLRSTARRAEVMHGHGVSGADLAAASRSRTSGSGMPLASLLQDAAARLPNQPGIVANGKALSYLELDLEAQRIALRLVAAGVGLGDRVALHMRNGIDLALGYFACFYAGAIAVPVNTRMKAPEIEYLLAHS